MKKLLLITTLVCISSISVVTLGRPLKNASPSPPKQPNLISPVGLTNVTNADLAKWTRFNVDSPPNEEEANYVSDMGFLFNRFIKVSPCNPENFIFGLSQLQREIKKRKAQGNMGVESMSEMFKAVENMAEIDQARAVGGYLDEMLTQAELKYKNASDSLLKTIYREMRSDHLSLEFSLEDMEEWKTRSPRQLVEPDSHSMEDDCPCHSCGMGDETGESNEDESEEDGDNSGHPHCSHCQMHNHK